MLCAIIKHTTRKAPLYGREKMLADWVAVILAKGFLIVLMIMGLTSFAIEYIL